MTQSLEGWNVCFMCKYNSIAYVMYQNKQLWILENILLNVSSWKIIHNSYMFCTADDLTRIKQYDVTESDQFADESQG